MPVLQVYPLHEISIRLLRSGFHTLHLIIGSPSQANRGGGSLTLDSMWPAYCLFLLLPHMRSSILTDICLENNNILEMA